MSDQLYKVRPLDWKESLGKHEAWADDSIWCRLRPFPRGGWILDANPYVKVWPTIGEAKAWVNEWYEEEATRHMEPVEKPQPEASHE